MSCLTLWLLCVMVQCVFSSIALYNVVVVMCNVCKGGFLSCQYCLLLLLFLLFCLVSTEGFLLQLLCDMLCSTNREKIQHVILYSVKVNI